MTVCLDSCARVRVKGGRELAIASSKTAQDPKVTYQLRTHASKFKEKHISYPRGNTNPWESPTWKIWKSGISERQTGNSQLWCLQGAELIGSHPSVESMSNEVMHCDTGALPQV